MKFPHCSEKSGATSYKLDQDSNFYFKTDDDMEFEKTKVSDDKEADTDGDEYMAGV